MVQNVPDSLGKDLSPVVLALPMGEGVANQSGPGQWRSALSRWMSR